jgi:hypothetical protein
MIHDVKRYDAKWDKGMWPYGYCFQYDCDEACDKICYLCRKYYPRKEYSEDILAYYELQELGAKYTKGVYLCDECSYEYDIDEDYTLSET